MWYWPQIGWLSFKECGWLVQTCELQRLVILFHEVYKQILLLTVQMNCVTMLHCTCYSNCFLEYISTLTNWSFGTIAFLIIKLMIIFGTKDLENQTTGRDKF
jgi:hypothetical protein